MTRSSVVSLQTQWMNLRNLSVPDMVTNHTLSKILNNINEILQKLSYIKESKPDSMLTSSDAVLLAEYLKKLRQKADIFNELDEKIIEHTDDEEKLEAAVFESGDLQTMLSEKIAVLSHTVEVDSPRE